VRNAEKSVEKFLARFKFWGASILRVAKRARVLLFPGMLFEEMGFSYFGPIDGHDVVRMVQVLQSIKQMKGPILLHCVTKKGKGYAPAEADPYTWHGPGKFDPATGQMIKAPVAKAAPPSYSSVFGKALIREAEKNPRSWRLRPRCRRERDSTFSATNSPSAILTWGWPNSTRSLLPAGLPARACGRWWQFTRLSCSAPTDQIEHDICIQHLPVVFCLDRAGLVGEDGPTHHGVFDYSYLRMLPNITVMAPADENELQNMLKTGLLLDGPSSIRYPRGNGNGVPMDAEAKPLPVGRGVRMKAGTDVTLAAIGNRV